MFVKLNSNWKRKIIKGKKLLYILKNYNLKVERKERKDLKIIRKRIEKRKKE